MSQQQPKIVLISAVPMSLLAFYADLISTLRGIGYTVITASSPDPELAKLRTVTGCEIYPVTIQRKISPFQDLYVTFKLWSLLRRERPDIVHAHTIKAGLVGLLAAFFARVPNRIYTIHGLPWETESGWRRMLLRWSDVLCCRLATKRLAVSPSLRAKLISERIASAADFEVLEHGSACGIDTTRFSPENTDPADRVAKRQSLGISPDEVVVIYIGRLTPPKGIGTLVDAFRLANRQFTNLSLVLCGALDVVRESLAAETMRQMEADPNIKVDTGFIDPMDYLPVADILVLPSLREGFGLTLLEANAMEMPVIATSVTGCVDAVDDGQTGVLVPPNDALALANAILQLANSPETRREMGQRGRKRVVELFSREQLIAAHVTLYQELL